jgi:thymidine phosphorylase
MAFLSGAFTSLDDARSKLTGNLTNGAALEKFRQMVTAQGGNPRVADDPEAILPRPGMRADILAPRHGWIRQVDAEAIGRVALQLGAGRKTVDDKIDLAAGVDRLLGAGTKVTRGQPLMRLCGRDRAIVASQFEAAAAAVIIGDTPPAERQLILETVT